MKSEIKAWIRYVEGRTYQLPLKLEWSRNWFCDLEKKNEDKDDIEEKAIFKTVRMKSEVNNLEKCFFLIKLNDEGERFVLAKS